MVRPSQSELRLPFSLPGFLTLALLCLVLALSAPDRAAAREDAPRLLAPIQLHTAQELFGALQRARQLVTDGRVVPGGPRPVVFVLHGPEVRTLLRQNYLQNRELVDLAASLSGLGVVEIKACESWMGGNLVSPQDLHVFVDTVPYGPAEVRRLQQQDYLFF